MTTSQLFAHNHFTYKIYKSKKLYKKSISFVLLQDASYNEDMKSKVIENKKKKKESLLQAAFDLLSQNDIIDVTVNDIVRKANLAKGTFYLYFKDKYNIRDALIQQETTQLFNQAIEDLNKNDIRNFEDAIIYVINHVLISLENNQNILRFIQRNLSIGVFHTQLKSAINDDTYSIIKDFSKRAEEAGYHYERPDIILYMIIELAGSTCYDSILHDDPLPIDAYKPYLFNAIRSILHT